MLILAVESSCDETSVAVVEMEENPRTRRILSNRVASQIPLHAAYGGVVPEIASRAHAEAISSLAYDALEESGVSLQEIGAVGVTAYPGLIGALLVGVNFAKGLAVANGIPLVPVNHIHGHIAANYFSDPAPEPPFLALVASGGHTSLSEVRTYTDIRVIGRTRDDAVGEAFDKVARILGIPYPGGAELDRIAYLGDPDALKFPLAAMTDGTLDFSFSGLKTAVMNYENSCAQKGVERNRNDVAAAFTRAAVESLVRQMDAALKRTGLTQLAIAGGVAANSHLRKALENYAARRPNLRLFFPDLSLCGDNAAMIGAQAFYAFLDGVRGDAGLNAYATSRHDENL